MRLSFASSSETSTRGLSPSATVNGCDDRQKEMARVVSSKSRKEKERERENARVILVLRMFQVR